MSPRQKMIRELMLCYRWDYAKVKELLVAEHRTPLMEVAERERGKYEVSYRAIRRVAQKAHSQANAELRQTRRSVWYKLWLAGRLRMVSESCKTDHSPVTL